MLVIFTKRRTRAVSSLYLSPSNGTHNNVSSAGCCCWSLALVSYLSIRWWGNLDTGVWTLGIVCFLSGRLEAGFSETQPQRRGQVGRGGHPTSPISGVINLQFYSLQLDDRHSTKPVEQHQHFYAFLLLKTYWALYWQAESSQMSQHGSSSIRNWISSLDRFTWFGWYGKDHPCIYIDLRYMNVR